MRTDLCHLPQDKQDELRRITELIREAVDPEMVILFGSHARGDWVEDRYEKDGVTGEYVSDYDLLLVVPSPRDKEHGGSHRQWQRVERRIRAVLPPGSHVNAIAQNIDYVNTRLAQGHYFFVDIAKEGILLYDSGRHRLCKLATTQVPELIRVFPQVTPEEKQRFELLNRAYIDARYDPDYEITREDLEYLGARVRGLRSLTEEACRRKIEGLTG